MSAEEPHPDSNLQRVRFELRAAGVPREQPNPLRSGIHSRGYLPHVKREGATYFVTFRLADSLPRTVLLDCQAQHTLRLHALEAQHATGLTRAESAKPHDTRGLIERDYRRALERALDQGLGSCALRQPEIAAIVADALRYFDRQQYLLDDWVVMPNHVHVILWPMPNWTLSQILKSRKLFTARQANRLLGCVGRPFWQPESYDHWIRDDAEKSRIRNYIRMNPVKAGLCAAPEAWRWSSAWRGGT